MAIQIICINKDNGNHENPHLAITDLGWIDQSGKQGKSSRIEMYEWVREGGRAYVKDSSGDVAYLEAMKTASGTKYVRTIPDGIRKDNLLYLKECK